MRLCEHRRHRVREVARRPGTFTWDRSGTKRLFYSDKDDGHWPNADELERIQDYIAAVG